MNKATVIMEIEIPDGYELAEPAARRAKLGEHYLTYDQIVTWTGDSPLTTYAHPIIRKKWEPEIGKWYMFSDYHENVGSCSCPIGRLTAYNPAWEQPYRALGSRYSYCWPVPNEVELGE